ncbi:hypothetical protein [Actinophytocola sp.]|uniref:hypothetical protein n=1 Tax=Actinophytocola sp. TaxID=1872138 RepID=UPI00389AC141
MKLFGRVAATEVVRKHRLTEVAARVEDQFAAAEQWTVVEIRRVYRAASVKEPTTGKSIRGRNGRTVKNPHERGDTWRSIRPCYTAHTREQALAILTHIAAAYDTAVWTGSDRVPRAEVRIMPDQVLQWPITTHEFALVAGPVNTKQRAAFEAEWADAGRQEYARGGGITPLPLAV